MFPRALRVGSLAGVDVRVDPSWLLVALLVTISFAARFAIVHDRPGGVAFVQGLSAAVLFFGSVLVHELAHALEGRHRGLVVHGVTLFVFGGVTELHLEARRPRDEFVLAAVGPWASLVVAALFALGATQLELSAPSLPAVAEVLGLLGWINFGLAVFNLLPGAPLDGGRLVAAGVWAATGDRIRSLAAAARGGIGVALVVATLAAWQAVDTQRGGLVNGVWLAAIAWFLFAAARAELDHARALERLAAVPVRAAAGPVAGDVAATATLDTVTADAHRGDDRLLAVLDHGRQTGVLRVADALAVPASDRVRRTVDEVAIPVERLPVVTADAPLDTLVRRPPATVVRVEADGALVGFLTAQRVTALVERLTADGGTDAQEGEPWHA